MDTYTDDYIKSILSNSKSVAHDTLEKSKINSDMNIVCNIIRKYAKSSFVISEEERVIKVIYVYKPIVKSDGVVASCHVNYII